MGRELLDAGNSLWKLPSQVCEIIVGAYNDAAPIFLYLVPLVIAAVVLLLFVKGELSRDDDRPLSAPARVI